MTKTVKTYKVEIETSINQLVDLVKSTPNNQLYWKPSEQEWSLIEVLAHVEEILNYWVAELERVISSPGTAWGRGMDAHARLAAVRNASNRSFEEVIDGINKAKAYTISAFDRIREEELDIESPHRNPKFGVKNMRFLVDHFFVEHLEKHITQVKRVQNQYKERSTLNI